MTAYLLPLILEGVLVHIQLITFKSREMITHDVELSLTAKIGHQQDLNHRKALGHHFNSGPLLAGSIISLFCDQTSDKFH